MMCKLSDICEFVKGKVAVSNLTKMNYISTENMLPNRGGIVEAATLPSVDTTQTYTNGDILVSNIRPYFKKIWFATTSGGCSNDVLVFRAKKDVNPFYLYYILSDDRFFNYATATSKGTKMPRGDKIAIMNYEIEKHTRSEQDAIASILRPIDEKIALNREINNNLVEQIKCLCSEWLEHEELPERWSEYALSDLAEFISGYSYKSTELVESSIAMATIKNFDRNGGFKLDGYKELQPSSKIKPTQFAELFDILVAHTDLTQNAEVVGNAEMVMSKGNYERIAFSMDLVKVVPKQGLISNFLLAAILQSQRFKSHCLGYVNGSTVLHLSKKALPEYRLWLPNNLIELKPLDEVITGLYKRISANITENILLQMLHDTVLPKLMSGEIDVSVIEI